MSTTSMGEPVDTTKQNAHDERLLGGFTSKHTCSIDEAARLLGIGRSTAYAAARDGSLPTLRLSHRLLVPTAKLLGLLGVQTEQGGES